METLEFNEELHEYKARGMVVPGVSQVLQGLGFIDTTWMSEFGRDRGHAAHKAILYYDEGTLDHSTLDPEIEPRLAAWVKFKQDMGWVSRIKETPMFHPVYNFAGTPDDIGTHQLADMNFCIVDIKTGQAMPYHALQLALYASLLSALVDVDPASVERIGVHLKADASYKIVRYRDKQDIPIALAAVSLHHWKKNNGI
jgi:hypothetical protein